MSKRVDVPALIFATVSVLYPLIAVVLLRRIGATAALVTVIALLGSRLFLPAARVVPLSLTFALVPVLAAMIITGFFDRELSLRLYPVFMNIAMLAAFGATLLKPPTMIERFARSFEPELPASGVRYTRNVTLVWAGFFAVNGAIALWTVWQPGWNAWMLYNGFIAYVAAGLLFAGEFLVRRHVKRKFAR